MITSMKNIPVTRDSHPFITAVDSCELKKYGYIEEEYFQSGTANIYDENEDGSLKVTYRNAPYTTRLLVRRPKKAEKFSGNVVIEILNASANFDIDRDWMLLWRKIVRDGDIYIGITSKGHVVDALKRFDEKRYAPINWANPTPDREGPAGPTFDYIKDYEMGLFWDMIVDLAKELRKDRSELNPLKGLGKNWLFLAGWSQSGSYLARIVHTFACLPKNRRNGPLFDGYFNSGSGAADKALNSYKGGQRMMTGRPSLPDGASFIASPEPFMAVNTESENRRVFWHGDFDEPGCKFRTWQIPCSSHDTKYTLIDYYKPQLADMEKAGTVCFWEGVPENGVPMDTPYEPIFAAAFKALIDWARYGIPAPHAPKIKTAVTYEPTDMTGSLIANRKDIFGNALGGIRYPFADCPTGTCRSYTVHEDGKSLQMMFGTVKPFSPELINAIYQNEENYRRLAAESTDAAIAKGFILPEDREYMIESCVRIAKERGLR